MREKSAWFGTRDDLSEIRCPSTGLTRTPTSWRTSGTYLSGGGYARSSGVSHQELSISWGGTSVDNLSSILAQIYKNAAYYYIDPLVAKTNMLPPFAAQYQRDNPFGVGVVQTGVGVNGYPNTASSYVNDTKIFETPVPLGYNLWVGAHGTGSVEVSGGPAPEPPRETRRNFALNPSFESVAGSWEVARNYHVNPGAVSTSGFGFFSGGGNTASMSVVAAGWSLSGSAARVTWTAVRASEGDINAVVGPIAGVGTVVTVVFRWVASRSGMVMGAPGAYDENVGYIATTARSRSVSLTATAGEVVEDWATFAIPQWATADLHPFVNIIGKQAGDSVDMSMADAYLGEYQPHRKWFSGNFSPDGDLTPSWTGSTNASASVLRATGVSGVVASDASSGWNIASSQWASSGVRSVRNYRPAPGLTDSFIRIPNDWFPGFAPGKVYGVKAKIRLEKPLSGSIIGPDQQPTRLRRFMAVFGGVGEFGSPDQYPNEAGVHKIQWVFTVPESATGLTSFRVYSGHGDGDHWVDDVMVVSADTEAEAQAMLNRPYFDGGSSAVQTVDGGQYAYYWEGGAEHNGQSYELFTPQGPVAPAIPVSSPVRVNASFPGGQFYEVIAKGGSILNGCIVQLLPEGVTPSTGGFVPGLGHSTLRVKEDPQITEYSAALENYQIALTCNFTETGAWEDN